MGIPAIAQTTLGIKTFNRPACVLRLLKSIRSFYPDLPILLADDGLPLALESPSFPPAASFAPLTYLPLPFDTGLSFGRNQLIEHCSTPYFVLLDDDFIFTPQTRLEALVDPLAQGRYDLVGGMLLSGGSELHYEFNVRLVGGVLHMDQILGVRQDYIDCDMVFNFFAARTDILRRVGWDEQLKLVEHGDFFLRAQRAGVRVGYTTLCRAEHGRDRPESYAAYRLQRAPFYLEQYYQKHGINHVARRNVHYDDLARLIRERGTSWESA